VGVQSSAFVRLSRFGREQVGVPIATLPLQEDARASLKEVFVVEAVRVWRRRSARSKQGERWTRGDPERTCGTHELTKLPLPGPAKFVARPTRGPSASQKADQQSHEQNKSSLELPWHVPRWRMADPSTVHTASGAVRHSTRRRRRLEGARCAVHATFHVGFVTGPWPSASSRTGLWRPILSRCPEPYSATASSA